MEYRRIYSGSLFVNPENNRVYRKHSNAFSVDVLSGSDAIFDLKESVIPCNRAKASELTGLEVRYL